MAPPELSSLSSASATGIISGPKLYLSKNLTINSTASGIQTTLPLTTSSVVSAKELNISSNGTISALTINAGGDINSNGYINVAGSLNSTSINVKGSNLTISDMGVLTTVGSINASGNLSIGDKFGVDSSSGDIRFAAATTSGSISIGGTSNSPNMILGNDGKISAVNDLTINTDRFKVTASSGNVSVAGDLAINTNKFTVASSSGDVFTAGTLSAIGNLAINTNKFTVAASSGDVFTAGNVFTAGTLSATGDLAINNNKFTVAASSGDVFTAGNVSVIGDLSINSNKFTVSHVDGTATSDISYNSYVLPASSTNTSTTLASGDEPLTTSTTSKYLSTQEYVDTQIWNQTKRINTILGIDDSVVASFNNVYKLVTAFAGASDTVTLLTGINSNHNALVDKTEEIKTSVSTIVSQAYNQILVNCTPSVWQDECGPLPIPSVITSKTSEDGWYFSNIAVSEKINWYMPTNGTNMTVGDIQNLYMNIFAQSDVSLPFITIYTVPKNDGTNYASWANAAINYVFNSDPTTTSLTANKSYCLHTGIAPMNVYNKTCIKLMVSTRNKSNKNNFNLETSINPSIVSMDDKILAISVGTDSSAAVGKVNFVINSLNLCLKTGTTSFAFSNAGVATNYLFNFLFKKHPDFSTYPSYISQKEEPHVNSYDQIFNAI